MSRSGDLPPRSGDVTPPRIKRGEVHALRAGCVRLYAAEELEPRVGFRLPWARGPRHGTALDALPLNPAKSGSCSGGSTYT